MYNGGDFGRETEQRSVRGAIRELNSAMALKQALDTSGAPLNIDTENVNPDGKGYIPLRCDITPMNVGKLGK